VHKPSNPPRRPVCEAPLHLWPLLTPIFFSVELCKVSDQALANCLANRAEVEEVISLYLEYFDIPSAADESALEEQTPSLGFKFAETDEKADAGVEIEANMSPGRLAADLDFKNMLPAYFITHRHRGGVTPWDNPNLFQKDAIRKNPDMSPIVLHWHQLAGIHAIIRKNFSKEAKPDATCGMLVSDEVGLGKTLQAGGVIGTLSDLVRRQELKKEPPPMISKMAYNHFATKSLTQLYHSEETPFFGDSKAIPNLPHLIILPGGLIYQWEAEFKIVFKKAFVDILIYDKTSPDNFWTQDGPFQSSNQQPSNIIIIASLSVSDRYTGLYRVIAYLALAYHERF